LNEKDGQQPRSNALRQIEVKATNSLEAAGHRAPCNVTSLNAKVVLDIDAAAMLGDVMLNELWERVCG
jgi:hypothetical protein